MFGLKLGLPGRSSRRGAPQIAPEAASSEEAAASNPASPKMSPIASAVVLAAGAGVAFWWWTQWARGRAETEADLAVADVTQATAERAKDVE